MVELAIYCIPKQLTDPSRGVIMVILILLGLRHC